MNNGSQHSVCILFSGGSDSSLVAYRMSLEFEKVHLLTLTHSFQFDIGKSAIGFSFLDKKFPGKFKHVFIDINEILMQVYKHNYFKYLLKYRTLNMLFGCFACQAAFHASTIIYSIKNNIFDTRDGANIEYGDFSPMQVEIVNTEMKKLYADYRITHDSPIYHEHQKNRSDHQLYELGLRPEANVKSDTNTYLKYQGFCKLGSCSAVASYYLKHCKGYPESVQMRIKEHWIEMVPFLKNLINQKLGV